MKEDKGHRGFIHSGAAWYADAIRRSRRDHVDEVYFGIYHDGGGTSGEMGMRWLDLQSGRPPSPRLEVFNDGWAVLASMPDLIAALGERDSERMSPEDFCALLVSLGFKDATPRQAPEEESEGEASNLRRVLKEVDFDHLPLKRLRRVVEAVQD